MNVKELIEKLLEFPGEMPVMIQTDGDFEYMNAHSVRVVEVTMYDDDDNENPFDACTIQYE